MFVVVLLLECHTAEAKFTARWSSPDVFTNFFFFFLPHLWLKIFFALILKLDYGKV